MVPGARCHRLSRIDHKFDLMYAKRSFVHWYVGEEGERRPQHHYLYLESVGAFWSDIA